MLSSEARVALDRELSLYEQQTGHQVVVWIGDTIGDTPLDEFAVKAFQAWQIGRKGRDDGILMIVLARDRKIDIEVGYGLEDRVPDAIASRIIRDVMAPELRAGNADGAITDGVHAVLASIEGKPFRPGDRALDRPQARQPSTGELVFYGIVAIGLLILFVTHPWLAINLLFWIGSGRGGDRGGGLGGFGSGGGGGFQGGGGRSGGGGARGSW